MSFSRSAGASAPTPGSSPLLAPIKRRSFIKYAGATAGATALTLASCKKDDTTTALLDVGSGDVGVLNYAYALEQLESAFYTQVLAGAYFTSLAVGSAEYQLLSDLALHEKIHVDLLRTALTANSTPIKALSFDFSTISFSDRTTVTGADKMGVLNAAQMFEDLGVAAYNGAARFFSNVDYLGLAGKIVSVEARHAALLRDILVAGGASSLGNGFVGADVIDSSTTSATARMEKSLLPAAVLPKVNAYLATGSQLTAPSLV
ncbi:ferritin-like domain-containing protein [Hymenobacter sp. HMF4947]|uniref:Ferritin-like domain-containing protein n=1 Tax=Hymenobacter ginkgonis TaxID=2682976 RepID=A0A7K1TEE9_9BACT|nr:ferritin-like domain-containing protein [Hymenobacter ginkgonis]MVN76789.1 ferritin-like domain-containing protein [Hymenobacter ginkgonis]